MKKISQERQPRSPSIGGNILVNVISGALGMLVGGIIQPFVSAAIKSSMVKKVLEPKINETINYVMNHPDLSSIDLERRRFVVSQFTSLFPHIAANSPDLILHLTKSYLQYGTIPDNVLDTYAKIEERLAK
ncbi:MAG: hypothetical protein ACO2O4_01145 [Minisyncoccia bacterium]|jgi:hypothetical protein